MSTLWPRPRCDLHTCPQLRFLSLKLFVCLWYNHLLVVRAARCTLQTQTLVAAPPASAGLQCWLAADWIPSMHFGAGSSRW